MEYYAGIDVSLKESSVCVVDATGKLVREVKVGSEPECLVGYFDQLDFPVERIGLEAGQLSQWLHAALVAAGHEVVLLETRHMKAALSAMTVKTDRKDARGSRNCSAWGGIVRSTPNRRRPRTLGLSWLAVSFCNPSCSTSSSASGVSCAAMD
ncbi:transposase [Rhizobium azibense]|nr:transposase [Rhizobium azibense]